MNFILEVHLRQLFQNNNMHPLKVVMLEWLESGTESEKTHARWRLTLPFEDDPEPEIPPSLPFIQENRVPDPSAVPLPAPPVELDVVNQNLLQSLPTFNPHRAIQQLIEKCRYRGNVIESCGCNGELRQCSHPEGRGMFKTGEVYKNECYQCIINDQIKILLVNKLCCGDILVSTAAIRSLHTLYPGKYRVGYISPHPLIMLNNPFIDSTVTEKTEGVKIIELAYPLINSSNQLPISFLEAYTRFLGEALDIPLYCTTTKPMLKLNNSELKQINSLLLENGRIRKYWVINSGSKSDFSTKQWLHSRYQELVTRLRNKITFVQVGLDIEGHHHKPLDGAINFINKTNDRELIHLCNFAEGGIGPSTFTQHIFAALSKPYILIDSAREPIHWNSYPTQRSLIKHGTLPCCSNHACWKSHTTIGHAATRGEGPGTSCERPVTQDFQHVTKCLDMITVDDVINSINDYYIGGVL